MFKGSEVEGSSPELEHKKLNVNVLPAKPLSLTLGWENTKPGDSLPKTILELSSSVPVGAFDIVTEPAPAVPEGVQPVTTVPCGIKVLPETK